MASYVPSTVRLRRLGAELRKLREDLGWTLATASRMVDRAPSSLGKIERGDVAVRVDAVDYILRKYGVTDQRLHRALLTLARDGRKKGWWQHYGTPLAPDVKDHLSLEADATDISTFETVLVPGLLQIEGYARALAQSTLHPRTPREIESFVALRMKRQRVLNGPVAYNAIVDESALRRGVGGAGVIRSQLAHLQDIGTLPNITIQVVALGTGAYPGLEGPFEIMTLPEPTDFSVAIFDNPTGRLFVERDDAVRHHRAVFEHLRTVALSPDASQALIGEIASSL